MQCPNNSSIILTSNSVVNLMQEARGKRQETRSGMVDEGGYVF